MLLTSSSKLILPKEKRAPQRESVNHRLELARNDGNNSEFECYTEITSVCAAGMGQRVDLQGNASVVCAFHVVSQTHHRHGNIGDKIIVK